MTATPCVDAQKKKQKKTITQNEHGRGNGRSENSRPTPKKNLFLGLPFLGLPFSVDPDERLPEKISDSAVALEQRYARPRCLRAKYDNPGRRIAILPIS